MKRRKHNEKSTADTGYLHNTAVDLGNPAEHSRRTALPVPPDQEPKAKHDYYHGAVVTPWKQGKGSMGLGMFIFFGHQGAPDAKEVIVHEWGHTVQSVILGPLFLFVIGLPSVIWAYTPKFEKMRKEINIPYTAAYCEKWASGMGERLTGEPAVWR